MEKVFISKNYADCYTASSKAKYDVESVLKDLSFKNIGLPQMKCHNLFFGRIWTVASHIMALLSMPRNQLCFLQYPTYGYFRVLMRAKTKGNTVVTLIHDLNAWRFNGNIQKEIDGFSASDYIIVHTNKMKDIFVSFYPDMKEKLVVLNIFDYLYDNEITPVNSAEWQAPFQIAFAGNLQKSQFLLDIKNDENIKWNLFGEGWDAEAYSNSSFTYHGCFPPEELYKHLSSHFGLVWDGGRNGTENNVNKSYLGLIAPHKISLYLSSGIPVIVWDKSAMADFVIQNKIGIAVSSVDEIADALLKLSKADYRMILENVQNIGVNLRSGYYTKGALLQICKK